MSEETLERIATIVDTLQPLSSASAGEPVRAAEWNELVSGVIELARIGLARERTLDEALAAGYASRDHDHIGALDLSWFDPDTSQLVEGGLSRPDLEADLRQMRGEIERLGVEVNEMRDLMNKVRRRLDEIADRDVDRKQSFDDLAGRIEVFGSQEKRISEVFKTLGIVDERVGEALALRDDLAGAGDLSVLRRDLDELLNLRTNFVGADGTPLEMRDFERRLTAVEGGTSLPGGSEFDPGELRAEILAEAADQLDDRTRALGEILGDLQSQFEVVAMDVEAHTATIDATRSDVASHTEQIRAVQQAATAVGDLTSRTSRLETRSAQIETQLSGLALLAGRMDAAESGLDALRPVTDQIDTVESDLAATQAAVADLPSLRERVSAVERFGADIGSLGKTVNTALSLATQANAASTTNGERLTAVESQVDDTFRSIARLETNTASTRETVSLLSSELEKFRGVFRDAISIRPPVVGETPTVPIDPSLLRRSGGSE